MPGYPDLNLLDHSTGQLLGQTGTCLHNLSRQHAPALEYDLQVYEPLVMLESVVININDVVHLQFNGLCWPVIETKNDPICLAAGSVQILGVETIPAGQQLRIAGYHIAGGQMVAERFHCLTTAWSQIGANSLT